MIFGNKNNSPETSKMHIEKSTFLADMCRVCMMTSECLKEVIRHELTQKIVDMLNQLADIDVSLDDSLPSLICNSCYTRLRDSYNFKNLCIDSNNTLKSYVKKMQNNCIIESSKVNNLSSGNSINSNLSNTNKIENSSTCIYVVDGPSSTEEKVNVQHQENHISKTTNNNIVCNDVDNKTEPIIILDKNDADDIVTTDTPRSKRLSRNNKFKKINDPSPIYSDVTTATTTTVTTLKRKRCEKMNSNSDNCITIPSNINNNNNNNNDNSNSNRLFDEDDKKPLTDDLQQRTDISAQLPEVIVVMTAANNNRTPTEIIDVDAMDSPPPKLKHSPSSVDEMKLVTSPFEYITVKEQPIEYAEPSPDYLTALGLVKKRTDSTSEQVEQTEIKKDLSELENNDIVNVVDNNNTNAPTKEELVDIKQVKKEFKKKFKCKVCNDILCDYGTYRRHLASHGELPFPCKICDKRFKGARKLKEHVITAHSGGRPYSCSQCEAKFRTLEEFTAHLRRHAGSNEPHACLHCPRRFASARLLREHASAHDSTTKMFEKYKRTSSGVGDHACSLCDRKFRKRCDLERHERVHSGEKPYECLICGGRFQQAHNLTKHMVTHTGMRSYTCDICHKTFGRSDVLARHMHVHEVSKPHCCKICSRTFARHSQLVTHTDKKHPAAAQEIHNK